LSEKIRALQRAASKTKKSFGGDSAKRSPSEPPKKANWSPKNTHFYSKPESRGVYRFLLPADFDFLIEGEERLTF
jgi:hypothetical protein